MLCKEHWQTDVGQTELRESSDLSVTSGGLQLGLLLCAPWGTAGHTRPGVHTSRDWCLELHAFTKPSCAEEFQALLEFSFALDFFFFLKNICCWFSLVLKFCRVKMLTCFHLSVPLSHFFSSQFWCLLQFAYQSNVRIGLDRDLIWSQCCLSAKQMCIKMCIRKRSKLGLFRNFFNLHKLHW